jgi:hypothetical protein
MSSMTEKGIRRELRVNGKAVPAGSAFPNRVHDRYAHHGGPACGQGTGGGFGQEFKSPHGSPVLGMGVSADITSAESIAAKISFRTMGKSPWEFDLREKFVLTRKPN